LRKGLRLGPLGNGPRAGVSSHLSLFTLTGLNRPATRESLWRPERINRFPEEQYPSINNLAAAIKTLPMPTANVPPQVIEFTGSIGRFLVTFVVRQNVERNPSSWYWGIETGQRFPPGPEGSAEAHD